MDCGEDDVVYQWFKVAMQPLYTVVYMLIRKLSTLRTLWNYQRMASLLWYIVHYNVMKVG